MVRKRNDETIERTNERTNESKLTTTTGKAIVAEQMADFGFERGRRARHFAFERDRDTHGRPKGSSTAVREDVEVGERKRRETSNALNEGSARVKSLFRTSNTKAKRKKAKMVGGVQTTVARQKW